MENHQTSSQNICLLKTLFKILILQRESNHKQPTSTKVLSYKKLTTFTQLTIKIHTQTLATLTLIFNFDLSTNLQVVDDFFFLLFNFSSWLPLKILLQINGCAVKFGWINELTLVSKIESMYFVCFYEQSEIKKSWKE